MIHQEPSPSSNTVPDPTVLCGPWVNTCLVLARLLGTFTLPNNYGYGSFIKLMFISSNVIHTVENTLLTNIFRY